MSDIHPNIKFEFGDVEVVTLPDGSEYYYTKMQVGGKTADGESYLLVLDGPAVGERAYL